MGSARRAACGLYACRRQSASRKRSSSGHNSASPAGPPPRPPAPARFAERPLPPGGGCEGPRDRCGASAPPAPSSGASRRAGGNTARVEGAAVSTGARATASWGGAGTVTALADLTPVTARCLGRPRLTCAGLMNVTASSFDTTGAPLPCCCGCSTPSSSAGASAILLAELPLLSTCPFRTESFGRAVESHQVHIMYCLP